MPFLQASPTIMEKSGFSQIFSPGDKQLLGVCQHLGGAPKCWYTHPSLCIFIFFYTFTLVFPIVSEEDVKMPPKKITTSKGHLKQPLTGQNAQHMCVCVCVRVCVCVFH